MWYYIMLKCWLLFHMIHVDIHRAQHYTKTYLSLWLYHIMSVTNRKLLQFQTKRIHSPCVKNIILFWNICSIFDKWMITPWWQCCKQTQVLLWFSTKKFQKVKLSIIGIQKYFLLYNKLKIKTWVNKGFCCTELVACCSFWIINIVLF